MALSSQLKPLNLEMLFRGTVNQCMVHPRDVFRFAYKSNASSLILAHNHPQGSLEASHHDLQLTSQLVKASILLQVPILDHLILGATERGGYFSMADKGLLFLLSRDRVHGDGGGNGDEDGNGDGDYSSNLYGEPL